MIEWKETASSKGLEDRSLGSTLKFTDSEWTNMQKTIFLVDMNAFFISCEIRRNKALGGKPAAVAGDPKRRAGIILAANYEARGCGVRTAMTVNSALRLCPDLVLVPPDHRYYEEMSDKVMDLLSHYSPLIEQNSIDEAWLDMTGTEGLFGSPLEAAQRIMAEIRDELDLWCSIGIAGNKFLSKMASEMKKPLGITILLEEDVRTRLWPMPVGNMYGVGQKTAEILKAMHILTIGDLAKCSRDTLCKKLGKVGNEHHLHANGIDTDQILPRCHEDIKSIGRSTTLSEDMTDIGQAKLVLMALSDEISTRARRSGKKGHTVQITLKFKDFTTITRQMGIPGTDLSKRIYGAGVVLLERNWDEKRPVRLLGISITDFEKEDAIHQLSLFESPEEKEAPGLVRAENVQKAMDVIREKYGNDKVSWGSLLRPNKKTP